MNEFHEQTLIYPVPLFSRPLPAAIKIPALLSPDHCRRLIDLAERKGMESITKSRHDQETFTAAGSWLLPEDDELVFQRIAQEGAETNSRSWGLPLSGIYSPFSVLRYRNGNWIRPHTDLDYRLADATRLSCIVQLVRRDAFQGGVLTVAETESYDLDIGDAVFFPAQTIHTVSAVEGGERYVLAAWIHGPGSG